MNGTVTPPIGSVLSISKPKKQHPISTILKRTQIPGTPSNMKPNNLTNGIKKYYGVETSLFEAAVQLKTSIAAKLMNNRKSVSGNSNQLPMKRTIYRPISKMPIRPIYWSSK